MGDLPIHVASHPRSGTHLLMALLASNFFADDDLSLPAGQGGHWAGRESIPGTQWGRLGLEPSPHVLPGWIEGLDTSRVIYVHRDVRAVGRSMHRWTAMRHPAQREQTLEEYLQTPLDWFGSPGLRIEEQGPLLYEHWALHVLAWRSSGALCVAYEDLVAQPEAVLKEVAERFGLARPDRWTLVREAVGFHGRAPGGVEPVWTGVEEGLFRRWVPEGVRGSARGAT